MECKKKSRIARLFLMQKWKYCYPVIQVTK